MPAEKKPKKPATPTRDLTGKSLGDFRVDRMLGQGGMGEVYLAEQVSLKRYVALKVLRGDLNEDESYLQRFQAEAMAVAPISHPNIVSVISIGEHDGIHYMALEYVRGMNLREYMAKKPTLDVPITISIMRKVASALQRASEEGVVHRDIKPENVLLTSKGDVKVADFGLARQLNENVNLTRTGVTMGTPLYMSPEQVEGKPVDHRTDIYSFGVMCYHMLAGHPPFMGETPMAVAIQHLNSKATPLSELRPDLPPDLIAIVDKAMAKKVDDRYSSAKEIVRDLSKVGGARVDGTMSLGADIPISHERKRPATVITDKPAPSKTPTKTLSVAAKTMLSPRYRTFSVSASIILAIAAGAGIGLAGRETDLTRPENRPAPPPKPKIEQRQNGFAQVLYARNVLKEEQREAGLAAVLEYFPSDVENTVDAAQEILEDRLAHRDYEGAMQLCEQLIQRDNPKQRMFGYLFQGIVLSRQREASASNESFVKMISLSEKVHLDRDQLERTAKQYFLALSANAAELGKDRDPAMVQQFWKHFAPGRRSDNR